jgi:hypothetical protein
VEVVDLYTARIIAGDRFDRAMWDLLVASQTRNTSSNSCEKPSSFQPLVSRETWILATTAVWYFAIGSMINPTSLSARDLMPLASAPAELLDHAIVFGGKGGMASTVQTPGKSGCHGVLHLISAENMAKLDLIEHGYDRVHTVALLYDGRRVETATVYKLHACEVAMENCPEVT